MKGYSLKLAIKINKFLFLLEQKNRKQKVVLSVFIIVNEERLAGSRVSRSLVFAELSKSVSSSSNK